MRQSDRRQRRRDRDDDVEVVDLTLLSGASCLNGTACSAS